ncbi:MAG: aminomethyl-transferring glycine dehydrogenase subunit GcvPA [Spirochaetia bacterium]|nr:aminomethyl-transferring glycine dehydrogenase subunit GcvPA [Spirochaetia bacterium]MCF7946772.1 aminomethyl-transferring glycine dehydrogenase subunit GcvPA [Spirochaetia bacterium]MCF7953362.1 aminomethyl-transferring glycine dehydrogenase subunit GcvPA [Spirochaetales bacterium]
MAQNRKYSYVPHTSEDIDEMLASIGVSRIEDLFADIPQDVKFTEVLGLPDGKSEYEIEKFLQNLSEKNDRKLSFLGCGMYDHIIPAAVTAAASSPAFVTSYTPYQPEISQGMLQAIFEFQTMICQLTGLDVSNASLYDGHTAAAEAVSMAFQAKKKRKTVIVSEAVHPFTLSLLRTYFNEQDIQFRSLPLKGGKTDFSQLSSLLDDTTAAVFIQTPNIFGILEDLNGISELIHQNKSFFILSSNPMNFGMTKTPSEWGADIAVGDTQPFGLPANLGGPSVGYIAAVKNLLRKMPGRIVGETQDDRGQRAFVLTLQAREQHIKRGRATSNICTNQALAALTTSAYIALVGPMGLEEVNRQSMTKAHYLKEALLALKEVKDVPGPFAYEFTLDLGNRADDFIQRMLGKGFFAGVHLGALDSSLYGKVAVAVTEKRTKEEIDRYVEAAGEILKGDQLNE